MSFLSILLVTSAIYFAHARPDSQSYGTALSDTYPDEYHAPAVPAESSEPISDPKDYQHQLYGFMQDISKAVDQYMTPLMSKLEKPKQDELKNMGMNGFASYINYWLLLIEETKEAKENSTYGHPQDDSLPRDEIILQFESYYPLDPITPYLADIQQDDEEAAEE